ncbi:MAG TPA: ABC transporter substrate-binding protein [Actinomycetota bacterium]|nr:ABC transporter substrate-binding protein [Actinomycetota bacterium]
MRRGRLVVLVTIALVLAACGGDDEGGGTGGGAERQYKLTLIQGVKGDQFYVTMQCGAQEAAAAAGATLEVTAPDEFDASLQTPVVNAVVAKKPDAILVAPTDTQAMIPPLTQAKAAGIKLVFVDTTTENGAELAESEIASDNEEGGREAARSLAELTGGKGSVAVINVKPGISTTDARAKGFEEEIKKTPGLKYVGVEYSNDKPEVAAAKTTALLAAHPDLVGIFGTNLFSAEGAATGLRSAGATEKVKIVGFDAGPKQVEDLEQGIVQALIAQKPADIGKAGVEQAIAALKGEPTQKKIGTGFVVVTKDNMNDPDVQPFLYKSSC